MKASSIEILEKHKEHWHTLSKAGYIKNLEYPVKLELQKVIQDELDPYYHENLWCGECLANMVRRAYTMYERYQDEQSRVPALQPEPVEQAMKLEPAAEPKPKASPKPTRKKK